MATLAGQKIKDKYGNLLHVEGGVTATLKTVEDGGGTDTALSVSTDKVQVDSLKFTTAPSSGSSSTALALDSNNDVVLVSIGSGGGATNVSDLADVTLTTIGDGDLLYYENGGWVNYNTAQLGLISGIKDSINALDFVTADSNGQLVFEAGAGMDISYNGVTSTVTFESTSSGFEEMFIGAVSADITLGTSSSTGIMTFTPANNTTDSTSFHFKVGTAQLELDTVSGEYIENVSSAAVPVHVDIVAFTETTQNGKDITYTLQKWNGTSWNDIKSVTRSKATPGAHADSFWSIFMLGVNQRFRISLSTTTGDVTLEQESRVSFTVKEVGS